MILNKWIFDDFQLMLLQNLFNSDYHFQDIKLNQKFVNETIKSYAGIEKLKFFFYFLTFEREREIKRLFSLIIWESQGTLPKE